MFETPAMLHLNTGREFINKVLDELYSMWNEVKLEHGEPRRSQIQGFIDRANQDIGNILTDESNYWPSALKIIHFQKNHALHCSSFR